MKQPIYNGELFKSAAPASKGFTLIETLMVVGAISVLGIAIFSSMSSAKVRAEVSKESSAIRESAQRIENGLGLIGSFEGLSTALVNRDALAGKEHLHGYNTWGIDLGYTARQVSRPGDAFAILSNGVPADACTALVGALAKETYDIRVNGTSVKAVGSSDYDIELTATNCIQDENNLEFVYHSGLIAGNQVAVSLVLPDGYVRAQPPASTPVDGINSVDSVGGVADVGTSSPTPTASGTTGNTSLPPLPPAAQLDTVAGSPAPAPAAIGGPAFTREACQESTSTGNQTRSVSACPVGQFGLVNQSMTSTTTNTCPEAWDAPVASVVDGGWVNTSNTCSTCPSPQTVQETQWVNASSACPAGQVGSVTFERQQTRNRVTSYDCSTPRATLPAPSVSHTTWANTTAIRNQSSTCSVVSGPDCQDPSLVDTSLMSCSWNNGWSCYRSGDGWVDVQCNVLPEPVAAKGNIGWWHDGLGYVAGFTASDCVRSYEVQYQLLVLDEPVGGYTNWYRKYPEEDGDGWKPVTGLASRCNMTWDTPGRAYPQFPGDSVPTEADARP